MEILQYIKVSYRYVNTTIWRKTKPYIWIMLTKIPFYSRFFLLKALRLNILRNLSAVTIRNAYLQMMQNLQMMEVMILQTSNINVKMLIFKWCKIFFTINRFLNLGIWMQICLMCSNLLKFKLFSVLGFWICWKKLWLNRGSAIYWWMQKVIAGLAKLDGLEETTVNVI